MAKKKKVEDCLEELATALNLTKINDKYYVGRYKTVFKKTRWGFEVASPFAEDYPY